MAKKNKKGRTKKKQIQKNQQLKAMPPDQLMAKGDAALENNKIRDALKMYKQSITNGAAREIVMPKLFHAYVLRYDQLLDKKLDKEAETIAGMAANLLPAIPGITPAVMDDCLKIFPLESTIQIYKDHICHADIMPAVEAKLGPRLVIENRLDLAHGLPDLSPLKQNVDPIQAAVPQMAEGDWEGALEVMRPISRKSPYSAMKLFAKAMTAFGRDDRTGLDKALGLLDQSFPLPGVQVLLKEYASLGRFTSQHRYPETAVLLMGPKIHGQIEADRLEKAVASANPSAIVKSCKALGTMIRPESPAKAMPALAELIGLELMRNDQSYGQFKSLLAKLPLPKAQRALLFNKVTAFDDGLLSDQTTAYLKTLKKEFPDKKDRHHAQSLILLTILDRIQKTPDLAYDYDEELEEILYFFNIPNDLVYQDLDEIKLSIAKKAIELAPDNRTAYGLLMEIPASQPKIRKAMAPVLEQMVDRFDREHKACLRLADLNYMKGAFRKAEAMLAKAYERAPHDPEVKERYALSFIIAAHKNLKRQKLDLAARDLEKALGLKVASLAPILAEKRLVLDALGSKKFSRKTFDTLTQGFKLGTKLKTLLLFSQERRSTSGLPVPSRGFPSLFNTLKKQISQLTSKELADLLTPLKPVFHPLYPSPFYAQYLMANERRLLSRLDTDDFQGLIIDLARYRYEDLVIDELGKRKSQASETQALVLDFYYQSLCAMEDNHIDASAFKEILNQVDEAQTEQLRRISRKLAPVMPQGLKRAFETFDFKGYFSPMPDEDEFQGIPFDPDIINKMFNEFMADMENKASADPESPLPPFDLKKVFGKKCNEAKMSQVLYDLSNDAQEVIHTPKPKRAKPANQFADHFFSFMDQVRSLGTNTPDAWRRTGQKFAMAFEYSPEIVMAVDLSKSEVNQGLTQEMHYFIIGMRSGI